VPGFIPALSEREERRIAALYKNPVQSAYRMPTERDFCEVHGWTGAAVPWMAKSCQALLFAFFACSAGFDFIKSMKMPGVINCFAIIIK